MSGPRAGCKLLVNESGEVVHTSLDLQLFPQVKEDLSTLFSSHKSEVKNYAGVEVFIELIQPSISLILFGGGFDARPVSHLAKSLGWNVSVTDECVAHIAPLFFPDADKLSLCEREFIDREISVDQYTACVLMSHNYEYDRDVLKKLINTETPYIGILGPRKRFDKMLEEFEAEGILLTGDQLHRIHSPVGLDIGAETPDEIAVSIIAEVQSKFFSRSGGFLKYRSGPIHQREQGGDQVYKQTWIGDGPGTQAKSANK
jgi:xanthine/CO dehydrogenase XdhC/CoxF family maturation factor